MREFNRGEINGINKRGKMSHGYFGELFELQEKSAGMNCVSLISAK